MKNVNKKVLIFVGVFTVIAGILIIDLVFFKKKKSDEAVTEKKETSGFEDSLDVALSSESKERTKLYVEQHEAAQQEEFEKRRNIGNEDDLFADDALDVAKKETEKNALVEDETPTQVKAEPKKVSNNSQRKAYTQKIVQKPDTIQIQQQPRRRRRTDDPSWGGAIEPQVEKKVAQVVNEQPKQNTTKASIHGEFDVKSGTPVPIRLAEPLVINPAVTLPENTIISGIAQFGGTRCRISVENVFYNGRRIPVTLKVLDVYDGQEGLFVPSATDNQQVGKDVTNVGTQVVTSRLSPIGLAGRLAGVAANTKQNQQTQAIHVQNDQVIIEIP